MHAHQELFLYGINRTLLVKRALYAGQAYYQKAWESSNTPGVCIHLKAWTLSETVTGGNPRFGLKALF